MVMVGGIPSIGSVAVAPTADFMQDLAIPQLL
jgi:hypothetical protein